MPRVRRVELNGRRGACNLQLEGRRIGDGDRRDDGLDEDARLCAVD